MPARQSGSWSVAANWTPPGPPGRGATARFDPGTGDCTVDASPTIASLIVTKDYTGTITIEPGKRLDTGAGSVSGGTLLLRSDQLGNTSTLQASGGLLSVSIDNLKGSGPNGASPSKLVASGTGEVDLCAAVKTTMNLGVSVHAEAGGKVVFKGGGTFAFNNPIPNKHSDINVGRGSTLDIREITAINIPPGTLANVLSNFGTVTKSTADNETIQMGIFNRRGTFMIRRGTLTASGSQPAQTLDDSKIGSSFWNGGGVLEISGGATLEPLYHLYQSAGSMKVVKGPGGATGTIGGSALIEGGSIRIGDNNAAGTLLVTDNITLAGRSRLFVNIYVQTKPARSDQLIVGGCCCLRDTLAGDQESLTIIMKGKARTGQFGFDLLTTGKRLVATSPMLFPGGVIETSYPGWDLSIVKGGHLHAKAHW